jgi:phosphatidate cytidylyltransferase
MGVIAISAIFFMPPSAFNLIAFIIFLGGLWEWRKLCAASYLAFAAGVAVMAIIYIAYTAGLMTANHQSILLAVGVLYWIFKTFTLPSTIRLGKSLCLFEGAIALTLAWLAIVMLRDHFGVHSLMLALLMVWSADTFAYFGGKRFGSTKLAPSISPGKTREGVASGVIMAMLVATCYSHFLVAPINSLSQMLLLLIIIILVTLISVVGDLSESKLKRAAGMKDSGDLIPGHGGILDRIDGVMAGVVVYAFYAILTRTLA